MMSTPSCYSLPREAPIRKLKLFLAPMLSWNTFADSSGIQM